MMRKKNNLLLAFFLFLALLGCNKNEEQVVVVPNSDTTIVRIDSATNDTIIWTYSPTSKNLNIPASLSANLSPNKKKAVDRITEERFQLGRHLFYEKGLSRNNTVSCASCHQQSKAFTDGLQFSVGLNGELTPRNAMALPNMLWEDLFFWDAREQSMEQQALLPIQDHIEMDLTLPEAIDRLRAKDLYDSLFFHAFGDTLITPEKIAEALTDFQHAIVSSSSKYDKYSRGEVNFTIEEKLGLDLMRHPGEEYNTQLGAYIFMRGANCSDCHTLPLLNKLKGITGVKNNGLDFPNEITDVGLENVTNNPNDKGKFKTPTLRNIALTAPYMHDGRFQTLEEVIDHYNEHVTVSPLTDPVMTLASNDENNPDQAKLSADGKFILMELTQQEKDAIIAFLHTLTDEEMVNDPQFSNPFE